MLDRIKNEITAKGLIKKGERLLVAFSGGADSTALLLALDKLKKSLDISLFAAHFNHGIRGSESDADEAFSKKTAEERGIAFFSGRADVPRFASENGLSLETAARLLRYDFLIKTCKKIDADAIVTAHHAEDNAESILLHLIRGSGLTGLAGIKPRCDIDFSGINYNSGEFFSKAEDGIKNGASCTLIRPLLGFKKAELVAFLEAEGQNYRVDKTNFEVDSARNYIRLNILPALSKSVNPAVVNNICRVGEIAGEDDAFLNTLAEKELALLRLEDGFDREKLNALPPPIKKRCLRLALAEKATLTDIEQIHIEKLIELASMRSGARLDLPHCRARCSFSKLIIEKASEKNADFSTKSNGNDEKNDEGFLIGLSAGEYKTPLGRFFIETVEIGAMARETMNFSDMEKNGDMVYNESVYRQFGKNTALVDMAKLKGELYVRTRRAGDRFQPVNSAFRMKLKDFLISRRVDAEKRDGLPLVTSGGEIVFIPGFLVSDGVKLTEKTERILKITFFEE